MLVPIRIAYEDCHIAREAGAWFDFHGTRQWYAKNIRTALTMQKFLGPEAMATVSMLPDRIWLDVPFEEKGVAKKLGAKWDFVAKSWYAPNERIKDKLGEFEWQLEVEDVPPASQLEMNEADGVDFEPPLEA
ncbi:hypothetical protein JKP88DRAFT_274437 [Tribonema minus]|uniref:DUF5710 domain-containing protein n=1 Tax=Tribonema minus TaxID=303371 RepID=A0A835YKL0_9STRA|nr:hypothetical protein JKP88DRAFT_274437 [Tribonema minus]